MPGDREATVFRQVAAEVRAELVHIARTVDELVRARTEIAAEPGRRVLLYGAAALLETFYTGVERAFSRIARALGALPEGQAWHRTLLDDMLLDIPKVRPPVLRGATRDALARYLAFRHRFRNLYLFDLDVTQVAPLAQDVETTFAAASADLERFAAALEALAEALGAD